MTGWKHLTQEIKEGQSTTRFQHFLDSGVGVIDEDSFKDLIFDIIENGESFPNHPSGTTYSKMINGKNPKVHVSSNGFIITIVPN